MSAELHPGMQVRCVDASPPSRPVELVGGPLVAGRVYTVRGLRETISGTGLTLEEIRAYSARGEAVWNPGRFEPLGRRSFDHLLTVTAPREAQPA